MKDLGYTTKQKIILFSSRWLFLARETSFFSLPYTSIIPCPSKPQRDSKISFFSPLISLVITFSIHFWSSQIHKSPHSFCIEKKKPLENVDLQKYEGFIWKGFLIDKTTNRRNIIFFLFYCFLTGAFSSRLIDEETDS